MSPMIIHRTLLNLPAEILDHVFSFLDPYDLGAFAQTCWFANSSIAPSNQMVWRYAFLKLFDDPLETLSEMLPTARAATADTKFDWYGRLRERCIALKTITTTNQEYRRSHICMSTDTLVDIIETARYSGPLIDSSQTLSKEDKYGVSQSIQTLQEAFGSSIDVRKVKHTEQVISSFQSEEVSLSCGGSDANLRRSANINRPFTRSMVIELKPPMSENASRLHIYYGMTRRDRADPMCRSAARCIVYNFEQASVDNDFGPFKRDGSGAIDWTILEAVASSMGANVGQLTGSSIRLLPQNLTHALPYQTDINPEYPRDWAGVTRSWRGTYGYIDYSTLHQLNNAFQRGFHPSMDEVPEAHGGVLILDLKLDDDVKGDPRLMTQLPVCDDLPVLYFSGVSRPLSHSRPFSTVRGTVSLIPGGRQVRWRFIVRYGGADQWQLEGVQPAGIRSSGIFGRWTHCDHDEDGPIGPFCYYPDDLCESM